MSGSSNLDSFRDGWKVKVDIKSGTNFISKCERRKFKMSDGHIRQNRFSDDVEPNERETH